MPWSSQRLRLRPPRTSGCGGVGARSARQRFEYDAATPTASGGARTATSTGSSRSSATCAAATPRINDVKIDESERPLPLRVRLRLVTGMPCRRMNEPVVPTEAERAVERGAAAFSSPRCRAPCGGSRARGRGRSRRTRARGRGRSRAPRARTKTSSTCSPRRPTRPRSGSASCDDARRRGSPPSRYSRVVAGDQALDARADRLAAAASRGPCGRGTRSSSRATTSTSSGPATRTGGVT